MTSELTVLAGRFVAELRFDELPEKAVATARLGFADTLAALIAGLGEPVTLAVETYVKEALGHGSTPYLLGKGEVAAEGAALIDATAAHALDFDDYAFANHISAVLVPTILSAAAVAGNADGQRMAAAYVAGYEVWADLMVREPDHLHSKGWHPTAVFGPVGAAASAAHICRLDAEQAANALALAASHAGGLMANFGSMTKPYHAGRAAAAGVRSVLLTRHGLTAQPNALEDSRGLLAALSPSGNCDLRNPPDFGRTWRIEKAAINVKKYPTVGASQRCIDAILALKATTDIPTGAIRRITPRVSVKHAAVMPFADPKNPAEAKFSLPFACAAALRYGAVGLAELSPERLADKELRRLMTLVSVDAVEDSDPDYPVAAPFDIVTIAMADGSLIETPRIRRASGHADNPLDETAHWQKFRDCALYGGIDEAIARCVFERANRIDAVESPRDLFLNPSGRPETPAASRAPAA